MKRLTYLVLISTALAGCVYTPERLLEEGVKHERMSKQLPPAAAACFVKNTRATPNWRATPPRKLDDRGGLKVLITSFGMAHFEPSDGGTRITLWTQPGFGSGGIRYVDEFLHGC